jgi:hypothetical protein
MSYNRETKTIQNELQTAWQGILLAVRQMHSSSVIRPGNATDVFRPDASTAESKFNVGPVVFRLPERANAHSADLYVALSGWVLFGSPLPSDRRRTTLDFGTQVGYFRAKGDHLLHVYGVHYDMDEKLPGHPVFHSQMSSQVGFVSDIALLFNSQLAVEDDLATGLLRNVRTPTAQMDVFSVMTQIAADHLVSEASGPDVLAGFLKMREACDFFMGAAGRLAYLNSLPATDCYRSTHWYVRADADEPVPTAGAVSRP